MSCYSCDLTEDESRNVIYAALNAAKLPLSDEALTACLGWAKSAKSDNPLMFKMVQENRIALVASKEAGGKQWTVTYRKFALGVN